MSRSSKSVMEVVGDALTWVVRQLGSLGWWFESKTIILTSEGLARLWYHLDPRLYSMRLRIKRVTEGQLDRKSNKYAVFVLYSKTQLPTFTANLIDAIGRSSFNLVIVSNADLSPLLRAWLQEKSYVVIERANLGRDFGAYKDGLGYVMSQEKDVERVLLVNDSLFFFSKGLDSLIAGLDGPQDFIGVTEVMEFHYHVQSYMLSLGRNVIHNTQFVKFWKQYRPVSTRRWSIHNGEVKFTRTLTKAGFRPHVLFQAAELGLHLRRRSIRDVVEAVRLLPEAFRQVLYRQFDEVIGEGTQVESVSVLEAISQGVVSFPAPNRSDGGRLGAISNQALTMERWNFEILTSKIVALIAERNQVHVGGFLFMKFLGLPVIKRDIFFRQVYALEEVYRILTELQEPLRDEVLADLRRGGTAEHIKGFRKILFRHGSI